MANDVKVIIDLKKPAGKLGFGYPLILSIGKAVGYTECTALDAIATAGFESTTDTYKAAALMWAQNNPPERVAVLGVATADDAVTALTTNANKGWRHLVVVGGGESAYEGIVAWIETTRDKMLFATVSAQTGLAALGTGDRVDGFVHSNPLASAAKAGEVAGRAAGSFTYKNLILNGIDPMVFSDAELEAIHTANGSTFVTKAGDNVVTEGKVMSGEYADVIDSMDYVISNLEYQSQKALNTAGKIPYDNNGIAILESVCVNVMRDAYNQGIIATNEDGTPAYTVSYAKRESTTEEDRAARKYIGGTFSFTLAGAIHTVEVTGEVIL